METWHFLVLLVIVNSAIWAYFDASRIRDEFHVGIGPQARPPHTWAAWIFLIWPVMLPTYMKQRQSARLAERRDGPPPRFVTGAYTSFAVVVGILGMVIFGVLVIQGMFRLATLGLVIAGAGLFGGRESTMTGETTHVEIGDVGFEQVGFQAPLGDDDLDEDDMPADMVAYFANLGRGGPVEPSQPSRPTEGSSSPSPAGRDVPPTPRASAAPTLAPATSGESKPAVGVPYSPPPPGVVYTPSLPGAEPVLPTSAPDPTLAQKGPAPAAAPLASPPNTTSTSAEMPLASIVARAEAALPSTRRSTAPPGVLAEFQPLVPPEPGEVPVRRAAQAPPSPAVGAAGYASATQEPRSIPWLGVLIALMILGALVVVAWSHLSDRGLEIDDTAAVPDAWQPSNTDAFLEADASLDTDSDEDEASFEVEVAPPATDDADELAEDPGDPGNPGDPGDAVGDVDAVGETAGAAPDIVEQAAMEPWLELYHDTMGAVGSSLEGIDYDGLDAEACRELGTAVQRARSELPESPDAQIAARLNEALTYFAAARRACAAGQESQWARRLLDGKAQTHRAQRLMDERYQDRGVLVLELESEIGIERSPDSISGRYLAQRAGHGNDG